MIRRLWQTSPELVGTAALMLPSSREPLPGWHSIPP